MYNKVNNTSRECYDPQASKYKKQIYLTQTDCSEWALQYFSSYVKSSDSNDCHKLAVNCRERVLIFKHSSTYFYFIFSRMFSGQELTGF